MERPLFRGELVELRPLDRANLDAYTRWFRDPEVLQYLAVPLVPVTREEEEAWFERAMADDRGYVFSIHTLDDGRLIGNCDLHRIDRKNRCAGFGIVLGEKEYWGKGYGTDATREILRFAFDELNLHRVHLGVFEFNERGIRSYEKVGFRREGRARDALWRHGRWWDLVWMSILEDEWRGPDG